METESSACLKHVPGQTRKERFKRRVINFLPILKWSQSYKFRDCVADVVAGTTVGLTVVPQSIAYAAIAGLSPQYGLYSAYLGPLLYVLLGTCTQVTIGPTAVMGLLTREACGANFPECAILASFWTGILQLIFAALKFGCIINFISEPVTVGFTFSAAVIILFSQLGNLLGMPGDKGNDFIAYCSFLVSGAKNIRVNDVILGLSSLIILLCLKNLGNLATSSNFKYKSTAANFLWLISTSKNAIVVILSSTFAYLWPREIFSLTGPVTGGLPEVNPPQFCLPSLSNSAENFTGVPLESDQRLSFWETMHTLGTGPLVIALISIMQNVAISKAFDESGKVNVTQEMIVLGLSNTFGSFLSAIPVSGSFSRSAVNNASGVRSPAGGLLTGAIVILSLTFLTPSFYYIPKASLAAVIICAVIFMGDFQALATMWKIRRVDLGICIVTFASCLLLGIESGMLVGVGVSLAVLLLNTLRPNLYYEIKTDPSTRAQYLHLEPHESVKFSSVNYLIKNVRELLDRYSYLYVVVFNFEKWSSWDYTTAITFAQLYQEAIVADKAVVMQGCSRDWALALVNAGVTDVECFKDSFFEYSLSKLQPNV